MLLTAPSARRVHQDGIHFQSLRYVDLTLAAYVDESVTIRYEPRDLAEIRVYHRHRFLCRAICPDLAGATIELKDLVRARNIRQSELQTGIAGQAKLVDLLLRSVATDVTLDVPAATPDESAPAAPRLKRYVNE